MATWLLFLAATTLSTSAESSPRLAVEPTELRFAGPDELAQVVVSGMSPSSEVVDLTHASQTRWESTDSKVARIDSQGRVISVGPGHALIRVTHGQSSSDLPVLVEQRSNLGEISFAADVVPIFTKRGCNAGSCHGKASGQNGFRLSLLGFEPALDYESLVLEGRGRRTFPLAPEASLLLRKPTAQVPHGGGQRFAINSVEYHLIERWVAQGMPRHSQADAVVQGIKVSPNFRRLTPDGTQQLRVIAQLSDGQSRDVTYWTQFQSNAPELASVDENGRVKAQGGVGETAIAANFRGAFALAMIAVPSGLNTSGEVPHSSDNLVDRRLFEKFQALGISPSPPYTDAEFARRSSLDICGILPELQELAAFLQSTEKDKRKRWIDRLLERSEYADFFAMKWGTILRNQRTFGPLSKPGTFAFHAWLRQQFANNRPFHQFVGELLTAQGDPSDQAAVIWYRNFRTAEDLADNVGQLFLGLRLQCARCHHHPSERWSQKDYYGFAAFFSRLGHKPSSDPVTPRLFHQSPAEYRPTDPTQGDSPQFPATAETVSLGAGDDPREALVNWLQRKDNPYFARAVVNRYWKHFFGRGLAEPEDDFRASAPPSHPELLEDLAQDFVGHGYDLKHLIRVLTTSQAYGRSSLPTPDNNSDRRYFARFYPRRLPAEVLLDAIGVVTGSPEHFEGFPPSLKAVQLPDNGVSSRFLDAFGRPKRESVCECERNSEPDLTQGLLLLSSEELQLKLNSPQGRASRLAVDSRSDHAKVDELYQLAFSRLPNGDERATCLAHLARSQSQGNLQKGYEDLIWTLINTKEFLFNH